jgi:hypothetical protein
MHRFLALLLRPLKPFIDPVFSVEEAQASLSQARAAGTPYNLVITDFDLGTDETGLHVLSEVLAKYPGTPVITFSTEPPSSWVGFESPPAGPPFPLQHVSKPDDGRVLLPAVKRALGLA